MSISRALREPRAFGHATTDLEEFYTLFSEGAEFNQRAGKRGSNRYDSSMIRAIPSPRLERKQLAKLPAQLAFTHREVAFVRGGDHRRGRGGFDAEPRSIDILDGRDGTRVRNGEQAPSAGSHLAIAAARSRSGGSGHCGAGFAVPEQKLHRDVQRYGNPPERTGPRQFRLTAFDLVQRPSARSRRGLPTRRVPTPWNSDGPGLAELTTS